MILVPSCLPSWISHPLHLLLLRLLLCPDKDEEKRKDEEQHEEQREDEEECNRQEEEGEAPQHQKCKPQVQIVALRQGISMVLLHQHQVKATHPRNLAGMSMFHPRSR